MMWIAWFNARLPRVFNRCRFVVGARGFDRCGAVVVGELGAGPEPGDVADVAEHDRGDHRADTVQLGERRARRGDRVGDAMLDRVELSVDAIDVGEMLGGDPATLDVDRRRSVSMLLEELAA